MSTSIPLPNNAINTTDLEKIAATNPQYTKLLIGLTQIDAFIKEVCKDVVCNEPDPDIYSIKTEITSVSYSLYLFSAERNAIVGTTWPITTFLELCQSKAIEYDVRRQTNKILNRFGNVDIEESKVNWV